ncbi:hypothetical protein [Bradyrhizobium sp. CCBAU 11357]|uniref:hypothetical protein n=1 Tax=Bradyrhizobium sp. CCBAU 11357 TaxID=1630808 RepID=UPI0023042DC3|nr:hypothetical protein [Bradyrhizobium sp. CCBAU 11357]
MDDDPLLRRAERAIRECEITRKHARERLQTARLASWRVSATLRMIRANPSFRFQLEMADGAASAQENPEANTAGENGAERKPE